jgi:hypothetical protein
LICAILGVIIAIVERALAFAALWIIHESQYCVNIAREVNNIYRSPIEEKFNATE